MRMTLRGEGEVGARDKDDVNGRGYAKKLRRGKLHNARCAEKYIRVATRRHGRPSVAVRRRSPPPARSLSPGTVPTIHYTYHLYSSSPLCDYISHLCPINCFYYINNNNLKRFLISADF